MITKKNAQQGYQEAVSGLGVRKGYSGIA